MKSAFHLRAKPLRGMKQWNKYFEAADKTS